MSHIPVLLNEMLDALGVKDGGLYVDATFGGGGYTKAILDHADCCVIALDRDPDAALRAAALQKKYPDRLDFYAGVFSDLPRILGQKKVDGVVFDFGVSSFQIDTPERGFSFRFDGPLDMRMSGQGESAADIVNTYDEVDLANLIYNYGEERKSRQIAKAIVEARKLKPIETTLELANLIKARLGGRPDAQHPATLTFQALRIKVNNELQEIEQGLEFAESHLKPEGRLVAVTFHSLEDRLVKTFLRQRSARKSKQSRLLPGEQPLPAPTFFDLHTKGVAPSDQEISVNSRSRSSRLRAAVRLPSVLWEGDYA